MTTAITGASKGIDAGFVNQSSAGNVRSEKTYWERYCSVVKEGFDTGGLIGSDIPNGLRLSRFYSEQLNGGVATKEAVAITESAALFKNYLGALLAPKMFGELFGKVQSLASDGVKTFGEGVQSVADIGVSFFVAAKTIVDGLEASLSMGLVSKELVTAYKPFGLAGTASHGAREALSKDIPAIWNNIGKDGAQVSFSLLKLIKNVALIAVGSLALSAIFFKAVFAPWLIPVLLTASVTTSVASRFVKGLLIDGESKPKQITV